jgi:heme oxygenase
MSLKELTKEVHSEAERTEFAKLLMSGNINKQQYAQYLLNMLEVYSVLEYQCARRDMFDDLPWLGRTKHIYDDLMELEVPRTDTEVLKSTYDYREYLIQLGDDDENHNKLLAHLYVRHMGDLYGGQMIAKKVPGSGRFYDFKNRDELIAKIRERLTDDLGEEAKVAFRHAINIMRDLNEWNLAKTN